MTVEAIPDGHRRFDSGGPSLAEVGETAVLRRLGEIARETAMALVLGSGDDAALWAPEPGLQVALSQDAMVEGRDFRRAWITPRRLGSRALAVALSDLAGTAAQPAWCAATLCAPGRTCLEDVLEIQRGLCAAAAEHGCAVAGGDLSDIDGPLVIDVSVGGTVAPGKDLRRDRGRPGDILLVTGRLGRAAAGLRLLEGAESHLNAGTAAAWIDAQVAPVARLAEGRLLAELGVRCGGDLSDGLLAEAQRLAEAAGCAAELWLDQVPVDPELALVFGASWVDLALAGGEDFELLVAVPGDLVAGLLAGWPPGPSPLQVTGRLVAGSGTVLLDHRAGAPVQAPAIRSRHFG